MTHLSSFSLNLLVSIAHYIILFYFFPNYNYPLKLNISEYIDESGIQKEKYIFEKK